MSSEVDISVRDLSKVYRIYERPEHRLVQMATLGRVRRFTEFSALRDISLDIRRGETVGIIGRNGCGKSTLLQVICGTLQPSSGTVEVKGRIAALLELGAGFNGEFTGRENVYMNGAILGFSREEMDARFEGIAQFSGIGDFIERPVKTYSSGMYVRLAFAVATAVEPDILIVDEALSVGDEAFQRKCFARIEAIKDRGGTILFVSHGAQTIVQLCDRAILLDAGEKLMEGSPRLVTAQYQRLVNLEGQAAAEVRSVIAALGATGPVLDEPSAVQSNASGLEEAAPTSTETAPELDAEWLDPSLIPQSAVDYDPQGATIRDVRLTTLDGRVVNVLQPRSRYRYVYEVDFQTDCQEVGFGMLVKNVSGLDLGGATSTDERDLRLARASAGTSVEVVFEFDCVFGPGTYFLNAGVLGSVDGTHHYLHRRLDVLAFRVMPPVRMIGTGLVDIKADVRVQALD